MAELKDYYAILGVNENATPDEIRLAYKKAAKYYHPDLNDSSNAKYMFIMVNEAYEHLMNQPFQSTSVICSKCGKNNKPSSAFCFWCGNDIRNNKQSTSQKSNSDLDMYVEWFLDSLNNGNFVNCIKYSHFITFFYHDVFDGWVFRCVGIVGLYGIWGTNAKEYKSYLEKAKMLYAPNKDVETSSINMLLDVIAKKFKEIIWQIYLDCNSRCAFDNEAMDPLFATCKKLFRKTHKLISSITNLFGMGYLLRAYKYMNEIVKPISDDILQKKWPRCKEDINHGDFGDTYQLCIFTQWLTQAPFLDPNIKLSMNYNAIRMLEYQKKHISRSDTEKLEINTQFMNELKQCQISIENELKSMNEFKKKYGM